MQSSDNFQQRLECDAEVNVPMKKIYCRAILHAQKQLHDTRDALFAASEKGSTSAILRNAELMTLLSGEIDTMKTMMERDTGESFEDYVRE